MQAIWQRKSLQEKLAFIQVSTDADDTTAVVELPT
jgi:hypothetical protein